MIITTVFLITLFSKIFLERFERFKSVNVFIIVNNIELKLKFAILVQFLKFKFKDVMRITRCISQFLINFAKVSKKVSLKTLENKFEIVF